MSEKPIKSVLIVDDESNIRRILLEEFIDRGSDVRCPCRFTVDEATNSAECIAQIRQRRQSNNPDFDVIVFDICLEGGDEGLQLSVLMVPKHGKDETIRIVFTGFRNEAWLIHAMRSGVWDYIIKQDSRGGDGGFVLMSQKVVDSAVMRIRMLDLQSRLECRIAAGWYPEHYQEVRRQYSGKLIALWHEPDVRVIASGEDEFELHANLAKWRAARADWQQPLIIKVD